MSFNTPDASSQGISKPKILMWTLLIAFWTMGGLPFFIEEPMPYLYGKLAPLLSAGSDALIILAGLWVIRKPADIAVLVAFLVISIYSTIILNHESWLQWVNGSRYYAPLIFILPAIRYLSANKARRALLIECMDRSIIIFLWLQAICISEQFLRWGAGDHGGGSLGNYYSGITSTMIYMCSLYLMLKRWDKSLSYFENLKRNWWLILLLFPSFLNETKVSFIWFILYFPLLALLQRNAVKIMLILAPAVCVLLIGAAYLYSSATNWRDNVFSTEYIEFYLMGDENSLNMVEALYDETMEDEEGKDADLARGLKFAVLPWIAKDKPWGAIFGFGIGQFKGGTMIKKSAFARNYDWVLRGTIMMGMAWFIELGFIGVIWALAVIAFSMRLFFRHAYRSIPLQILLWAITIVMILYSSCFMSQPFSILFFYMAYASSRRKEFFERNASPSNILPEINTNDEGNYVLK